MNSSQREGPAIRVSQFLVVGRCPGFPRRVNYADRVDHRGYRAYQCRKHQACIRIAHGELGYRQGVDDDSQRLCGLMDVHRDAVFVWGN